MSYTPSQSLAKTAFGELLVAEVTPVIQAGAQYNLGSKTRVLASGVGADAGSNSDSMFYATSGTVSTNFASVFSKRSVTYKAGEGLAGEFTAIFDEPVALQIQRAGFISATDGYNFGYNGLEFGIFYLHHGQQEIQEFKIDTPATGSENATIEINGVDYTVPLTSGTVQHNSTEIQDSLNTQVPFYNFQQVDDSVVCRSVLAGSAGAFSFSSGTATATITQIAAGASITTDFIPMDDWNGVDVSAWKDLDGNDNPFNPEKGNVYKIQAQYLGFGDVYFYIEKPSSGEYVLVHTLQYANNNTATSVSNPSFRIGWTVSNNGATTSSTIRGASYAIFIEGKRVFTEPANSQYFEKASLGSTITNLLTIKVSEVYGQKVNLASVLPKVLSITSDSTKGAVVYVNLNATIAGTQDWNYHDKDESVVLYDTAGTTVTGGSNLVTTIVPASSSINVDMQPFNLELNPNDTLTIAIAKLGGGTHDAAASNIWQEDI